MASAVQDVYDHLRTEEIVDGSTGWQASRRRVHDEQDRIVVITEDGGGAADLPVAEGLGEVAFTDPAVQVLVRAEAWDSDVAKLKAQEIYDDLHGKRGELVGSTTYLRVRAQTSEPLFVGFDETNRPFFTTSFLMKAEFP